MSGRYRAIVSSDWNECLAPCGPFDFIAFNFPAFEAELNDIFSQYTGNRIALADAIAQIGKMLPQAITREQMDAYLAAAFTTYAGVPELIDWCLSNDILFMINTTGVIGYFQRVFAAGLLPGVPVVSAHPMVRYPASPSDPGRIYDLFEIHDKAINSQAVIRALGIPAGKVILMGDSGGDGPHLEWGAHTGAFLIGSMTKASLDAYCRLNNIRLDLRFGMDYSKAEHRDRSEEVRINFMDLTPRIEEFLGR
jgi:hypothetical protein